MKTLTNTTQTSNKHPQYGEQDLLIQMLHNDFSKELSPQTLQTFEELLCLEKITPHHLEVLNPDDRKTFIRLVYMATNAAKQETLDYIQEKTADLLSETTKQDVKEYNYVIISNAVSNFLSNNGRMPTKVEIAMQTGLSRKTVHKHLKDYSASSRVEDQVQQYRLMTPTVIDSVIRAALRGDMKAAKIFLDSVGKLTQLITPGASTIINQQNNYVQINKTVLSQQTLLQLPPEQLIRIEEIIKSLAPPAKSEDQQS